MTTRHTEINVIHRLLHSYGVYLLQQRPHVTVGKQSKRQHGIKILMELC